MARSSKAARMKNCSIEAAFTRVCIGCRPSPRRSTNRCTPKPMQTPAPNLGLWQLCRWACSYAFRRWGTLVLVLLTMLLRIGLDVLKPWPMVFLIDYVLRGELMPPWVANLVNGLPGAHNPADLAGWSVAATVLIFVLGWVFGVVSSYGDIALGQRMTYDL